MFEFDKEGLKDYYNSNKGRSSSETFNASLTL